MIEHRGKRGEVRSGMKEQRERTHGGRDGSRSAGRVK